MAGLGIELRQGGVELRQSRGRGRARLIVGLGFGKVKFRHVGSYLESRIVAWESNSKTWNARQCK